MILLVLLPFGEVLRFDLGNNIAIRPLDVTAGLLTVVVLFRWLVNKKKNLQWQFLLFPLVGLVSLGINSNWLKPNELLASFLYWIRWVSYFGVLFAVYQFDNTFKKIIEKILVIDGLVVVFFGFLQYFLYSNLRNIFYLGWDEHLYRMFSTFLDPNFAGAFFVLYFLFVGGIFFKNVKQRTRIKNIGILFVLAITLTAIFLTYSRSALLMLIAGSIVFLIQIKKKKLLFALFGIIILFIIIVSPSFTIENTNLFRVSSSKARVDTAQNALKVIQDHPIIGVGFDSYRYAQQHYGFRKDTSQFPSHSDAGVDNSLLFILATTGVIGFASYVCLWITIMKRIYGDKKKEISMSGSIFVASMVGVFIDAQFINSLLFPAIMLWMWVITGLAWKKK